MSVPVAQWIARWTSNPKVPGSNPGRDANIFWFTFIFYLILRRFYVTFLANPVLDFIAVHAEIPSKCSHERKFFV